MKKFLVLLIIITSLSVVGDFNQQKTVIPKEAIRFRVIANSDKQEDQDLKVKVKNNLQQDLNKIISNSTSLLESRNNIEASLPLLEQNVKNTLLSENSKQTFTINYGKNYFPAKEYKKVVYQEGQYESLVVTLGDGLGQNFWCVLFPPLCLLEAEESNKDVEYHIFVKDIFSKYNKKTHTIKG